MSGDSGTGGESTGAMCAQVNHEFGGLDVGLRGSIEGLVEDLVTGFNLVV